MQQSQVHQLLITRQQFLKTVQLIKKIDTQIDQLWDMGYCNDNNILFEANNNLIELLQPLSEDEDFISWWCVQQRCGQQIHKGSLVSQDGIPIDVSTPQYMWDFLSGHSHYYPGDADA